VAEVVLLLRPPWIGSISLLRPRCHTDACRPLREIHPTTGSRRWLLTWPARADLGVIPFTPRNDHGNADSQDTAKQQLCSTLSGHLLGTSSSALRSVVSEGEDMSDSDALTGRGGVGVRAEDRSTELTVALGLLVTRAEVTQSAAEVQIQEPRPRSRSRRQKNAASRGRDVEPVRHASLANAAAADAAFRGQGRGAGGPAGRGARGACDAPSTRARSFRRETGSYCIRAVRTAVVPSASEAGGRGRFVEPTWSCGRKSCATRLCRRGIESPSEGKVKHLEVAGPIAYTQTRITSELVCSFTVGVGCEGQGPVL
jgi:hypothetical protein